MYNCYFAYDGNKSDIKELKFDPQRRFRELLGHTRKEVFWGMLVGITWATVVCIAFD